VPPTVGRCGGYWQAAPLAFPGPVLGVFRSFGGPQPGHVVAGAPAPAVFDLAAGLSPDLAQHVQRYIDARSAELPAQLTALQRPSAVATRASVACQAGETTQPTSSSRGPLGGCPPSPDSLVSGPYTLDDSAAFRARGAEKSPRDGSASGPGREREESWRARDADRDRDRDRDRAPGSTNHTAREIQSSIRCSRGSAW
jgi:hypothetical protein